MAVATEHPREVVSLSDVSFSPAHFDPTNPLLLSLGAFDRNQQPLSEFLLARNYGSCGQTEYVAPGSHLRGTYLYGGMLFDHYGHFLLESLARLLAIAAYPDVPVLWHAYTPREAPTGWQREIFDLLGIDTSRFVFIGDPVAVERVLLSAPGYMIQLWGHPDHMKALARYRASGVPTARVWLSRSHLDATRGHVLNEADLEQSLQSVGWQVAYPEKLSVSEQLNLLGNASRIAGFAGSALHTPILIEAVHAKIFVVSRATAGINPNFTTIQQLRGWDQQTLNPEVRRIDGSGTDELTELDDVDALAAALSE